jgi:large subunit ribosomal protein L23
MRATDARDIIISPVVSEKTYAEAERGKYTFLVAPRATKPDIRRAVEQIWGVHVRSVNTLKRRGKSVRRHLVKGRRPDVRRAVVTLHPGEKIAVFEGS